MLKPCFTGPTRRLVAFAIAASAAACEQRPAAPPDPAADRTQVDKARLQMPKVSWVTTSFVTTDEQKQSRYELRLEDEVVVNVLSLSSKEPCPPTQVPADGQGAAAVEEAGAARPPAHLSLCEWAQFVEPKKAVSDTLNRLVPFINGVAVKGALPVAIEVTPHPTLDPPLPSVDLARFHYRLTRTEGSRDAWRTLLGRPGTAGAHRLVRFTLGTESGFTLDSEFDEAQSSSTDATQLQLMVVSSWWMWIVGLVVALMAWFLYKARTGDILRDRPARDGKKATYSLAKCQMAVWLFLVVGGYLLIWVVTRDRSDVPGTVLGLIGLSSATTVGALLIEARQRDQRRRLALSIPVLERQRDEVKAQANAAPGDAELQRRWATADADLAVARQRLGTDQEEFVESRGFLDDILSDGGGPSLHRFQMAIWTIVLALIFVVTAWRSLAMPEFSEGLLALMGISSGTYLGFKSAE